MKNQLGLTLIEIVITTSIVVLVAGLIFMIMVNNTGVFYKQSAKVSQGLGSNDTLASIRSTIKEGQSIATGYPEGSSPAYTSSSTTLVIKLPSVDLSGGVITGIFDFAVFTIEQGRLKLKIFPNSSSTRKPVDQVLALNADKILFEYFDSSGMIVAPTAAYKIKTTLVLKQKAAAGYETNIATSEATLRND